MEGTVIRDKYCREDSLSRFIWDPRGLALQELQVLLSQANMVGVPWPLLLVAEQMCTSARR